MIERLLVLKLDVIDCEAEAWLNGVPVARANAARPQIIVPVHEYTVGGSNQLQLLVWPPAPNAAAAPPAPPLRYTATGLQAAQVRLLLPRVGNAADEHSARTLGELAWAPAAGEPVTAPVRLQAEATLPVSFPRWRWLDAPVAPDVAAAHAPALALVQQLAQVLAAGDVEPALTALRLRTDELAVAYQRDPAHETQRLREHLLRLHAEGRLAWQPMDGGNLLLRPLAGGRLLECLDATGAPMLRTQADPAGRTLAFPLRLAMFEGRAYVLR